MTQDEANTQLTLAQAELATAHARLVNAQAEELEKKNKTDH